MAHSPHSSLSTPTPASLTVLQSPATPPRAPPTPPGSDISPRSVPTSTYTSLLNPHSAAFAPLLRPLPASPAASISPALLQPESPPRQSLSQTIPRSPTTSPSSSMYQSSFSSPNTAARPQQHLQDPASEDSDSSDVEIYLSNLGIEDLSSMAQSRLSVSFEGRGDGDPSPDASPVLPSAVETAKQSPPPVPRAPAQQTIPLPAVDTDPRASYADSPPNNSNQNQQSTPHSKFDSQSQSDTDDGASPGPATADSSKTPNVYINGLPPHFPEDQLFALAAPFGAVRSVRTFTRHVRDNESGYGFVLFETVDAAEKCIVSLRRYRNLHPTFSKQVHKIPGTYSHSQLNLHLDDLGSASSLAGWENEQEHDDPGEDASFKAKMESLHDPTSTNLYMEGLPLSIDEPTLMALVSPHRINSSRFFQTRLSNPPRIIAFVRFETRAGAEEIIERLHGRMVRGWNDAGSRISVRFADTAEQRELRRTERNNREGEQSPARITIAQAALLNLRGQDQLRVKPPPAPAPPLLLDRLSPHPRFMDHSHSHAAAPPPFAVDYSLAGGRPFPPVPSRTHSPIRSYHQHASHPASHLPPPMDPAMAALLESLRAPTRSVPFHPAAVDMGLDEYREYAHALATNRGSHHARAHENAYAYDAQRTGAQQARTGYTATEEFIMRAHADSAAQQQQQRRRPTPLDLGSQRRRESDASVGMGTRGYRTQAAAGLPPQHGTFSPPAPTAQLPLMNEDDFHANVRPNGGEGMRHGHNSRIHPAHVNARLGREQGPALLSPQQQQQSQLQQTYQQAPSPNPNLQYYQHAHLRSSTLPHRTPSAANQHPRHYQHSSMSIPSSASIHSSHHSIHDQQHRPQHNTGFSNNSTNNSLLHKNTARNCEAISIYDSDARTEGLSVPVSNGGIHYDSKAQKQQQQRQQHDFDSARLYQHTYDADQVSPSLISPALTYSAHTPSTLSPATPFFGSFGSQAEAFERTTGFDGKKTRAGSH